MSQEMQLALAQLTLANLMVFAASIHATVERAIEATELGGLIDDNLDQEQIKESYEVMFANADAAIKAWPDSLKELYCRKFAWQQSMEGVRELTKSLHTIAMISTASGKSWQPIMAFMDLMVERQKGLVAAIEQGEQQEFIKQQAGPDEVLASIGLCNPSQPS